MNERLKELRNYLGLSQEEFGDKVGIKSRAHISLLENGTRNLTDRVINDICREFNINEDWLKNGQGKMFIEPDTFSLDELIKKQGMSELEFNIVKCYFELDPEIRQAVVSHFKERLLNNDSEIAATVDVAPEEDPIEKEVNAYRLELEAEQKGEISSALEDIKETAN